MEIDKTKIIDTIKMDIERKDYDELVEKNLLDGFILYKLDEWTREGRFQGCCIDSSLEKLPVEINIIELDE